MLKVSIRFLLKAKKSVNILSLISFLALTLGICSMLVILCVMAGFEQEMKNRMYLSNIHLAFKKPSEELYQKLKNDTRVLQIVPQLKTEMMVTYDRKVNGATVIGVPGVKEVKISDSLSMELEIYDNENDNNTFIGLQDLSPDPGLFSSAPRKYFLPVQGYVQDPKHANDQIVYLPIGMVKKILKTSSPYNEFELETKTLEDALALADEYPANEPFTWRDREASLFYSLKLERMAMAIMLSFIVVVASFTIVSSVGMTAMEKLKELAILRCLGLSQKGVANLLSNLGFILGGIGVFSGLLLGLFICILLKETSIIPLPDVYVDKTLPVLIKGSYVLGVTVLGFTLVFLAAFIPSRIAGKDDLISVLRS